MLHPVRLAVTDDLTRSRLTVFFRLLLAIPHFIWLFLWSFAVVVVWVVAWPVTLVLGRLPGGLHDFFGAYVRYLTHVYGYLYLAANPYPGFVGTPGYPVDARIEPPAEQRRWTVALRPLLAVPAWILMSALSGTGPSSSGSGSGQFSSGAGAVVAFLGWFACLATGRMPLGMRNLVAFSLRYVAQTWAYLLFLTDRFPGADPATDLPGVQPEHPIRLVMGEDDLRRSRLTVFFRPLLLLPHFVWIFLWTIAALPAAIVSWFATLATGRTPAPLHGFLARYVRYGTHISLYFFFVGGLFPGFAGAPGSYPIELEIGPPLPQSRWKTGFRLVLSLPAQLISSALGTALWLVFVYGWFYGLATGHSSPGLRSLGAYAIRYSAQSQSYVFLLTERYPYSGPESAATG